MSSGKCLDVQGNGNDTNGATIFLYQRHGNANQRWKLVRRLGFPPCGSAPWCLRSRMLKGNLFGMIIYFFFDLFDLCFGLCEESGNE